MQCDVTMEEGEEVVQGGGSGKIRGIKMRGIKL